MASPRIPASSKRFFYLCTVVLILLISLGIVSIYEDISPAAWPYSLVASVNSMKLSVSSQLPPNTTTLSTLDSGVARNGCPLTTANGKIAVVHSTSYISQCRNTSIRSEFRKPQKLILFYNPTRGFFGEDVKQFDFVYPKCKVGNCKFTHDRGLLQKADAVVVHVCRINDPKPPETVPPRQMWIALCQESPINYQGYYKAAAWRRMFNWTMTYTTDSDFFAPYSFLVLRTRPSGKNFTAIALNKKKPVAWIVSNCKTHGLREKYVERLQKHIDVDIYGGCGSLKCPSKDQEPCMGLLDTKYYFYLSFENSLCKDYVTEKFFKVFNNVDLIPVVRGGTDYGKYFDRKTFINTADFDSPKHLAAHLHRLINDTRAYAEMLEAKDLYLRDSVDSGIENAFCEMCDRLNRLDIGEHNPDFVDWVERDACHNPTDL